MMIRQGELEVGCQRSGKEELEGCVDVVKLPPVIDRSEYFV